MRVICLTGMMAFGFTSLGNVMIPCGSLGCRVFRELNFCEQMNLSLSSNAEKIYPNKTQAVVKNLWGKYKKLSWVGMLVVTAKRGNTGGGVDNTHHQGYYIRS
jgi:hypothetical protein